MWNYNKLQDKQKEFIKKSKKRFYQTTKKKQSLFKYWDRFEDTRIDGKVFKSERHFQDFKNRCLSCGSFLEFKVGTTTDKIQLQKANFCKKHLVCASCAVGRAYNQQKKFLQSLEVYPYEHGDDLLQKNWYYIVTPVRHSEDMSLLEVFTLVSDVRKSAQNQMRHSRNRNTGGFWSAFNGGMGSVEVTRTHNGWNVHINWLVNSDKEIELKEIFDRNNKKWYQNDDLSKFLERFNDSYIHSISKLSFNDRDEIRKNLLEVFKYSLKFSSLMPFDLIEVYYTLYRKRLFFTFGNIRGMDLEAVNDVRLGDDFKESEEFITMIYERLENSKYILGAIFDKNKNIIYQR